ncbi:cytochrome c oxidase subunit 3 family protein [Piscinibacter sp.]|uniref:cytochrome c oxidase subunit 3 family protein n=1 Tax=Piscinibacter sp. TaxID=1903157 RepID=UPI0039E2FFD9
MPEAVMTDRAAPATSATRVPGEAGIWVLVFGDMMMFSLFFAIFLYYRGADVALFTESQARLNQGYGAINTFIMLSSSWFVAMAVRAAREKPGKATPRLLMAAVACGALFGVIKVLEYGEKIRAGIFLTTNDFFMYYFMFTGIHFAHVALGMVALVLLARHTRSGVYTPTTLRNLESGASFWHLVDLLWIVLFALLYLVK